MLYPCCRHCAPGHPLHNVEPNKHRQACGCERPAAFDNPQLDLLDQDDTLGKATT